MVSYQELHEQNHKITELTNILQHLLGDRSLVRLGDFQLNQA